MMNRRPDAQVLLVGIAGTAGRVPELDQQEEERQRHAVRGQSLAEGVGWPAPHLRRPPTASGGPGSLQHLNRPPPTLTRSNFDSSSNSESISSSSLEPEFR